MGCYTAEENNDILKLAGKWMDLENILLSEVTQTQEYNMYSLISGFRHKTKKKQSTIHNPREPRQ